MDLFSQADRRVAQASCCAGRGYIDQVRAPSTPDREMRASRDSGVAGRRVH